MHPTVRQALNDAIETDRKMRATSPERYAHTTFAQLLDHARGWMNCAREDEGLPKPKKPVRPVDDTSFAAIRTHLSIARQGLMQFGATDAQIDMIARLAVRDGLRASELCGTSGLTKREASGIISTFTS